MSGAAVEDADAVVVGVGVAEALAFDGFDDPVDAFGGPVGETGVEVGEQFGFPGAVRVLASRFVSATSKAPAQVCQSASAASAACRSALV